MSDTEDEMDLEKWYETRREVLVNYRSRYGGNDNTHMDARLGGYLDGLREGKRLLDRNPPPVDKPPYGDMLPEGVTVNDWECSACGELQMSIDRPSESFCRACESVTEWKLVDAKSGVGCAE